MGVPEGADAHLIVGLDAVVQLSRLPVPDVQLPIRVTRHHITTAERGVMDRGGERGGSERRRGQGERDRERGRERKKD